MIEKKPNLLVVDDEKNTRDALRRGLADKFEVYVAADLNSARTLLLAEPMDAVLTDLRLGNESGLVILELCRAQRPPPSLCSDDGVWLGGKCCRGDEARRL